MMTGRVPLLRIDLESLMRSMGTSTGLPQQRLVKMMTKVRQTREKIKFMKCTIRFLRKTGNYISSYRYIENL